MKWNSRFRGLTTVVFNSDVGSLEQSVKLGRLVIFDFFGNSENRKPKSSAFYSVFIVWAVFQLRWRKKTCLKRWPLFRSQIPQIVKFFLRYPRLAFDCLSVSFFDYLPIKISDLLLSLHWINPLLHWITWKLQLSKQSELSNFSMYIISKKTLVFNSNLNFKLWS